MDQEAVDKLKEDLENLELPDDSQGPADQEFYDEDWDDEILLETDGTNQCADMNGRKDTRKKLNYFKKWPKHIGLLRLGFVHPGTKAKSVV